MKLDNVLFVPGFKQNLLFVQKLAKNENCKVNFQAGFCIVQDIGSSQVKGVGRAVNGLYYLINEDAKTLIDKLCKKGTVISKKEEKGLAMNDACNINLHAVISNPPLMKPSILWHQRMGHAPLARLKALKVLKRDVLICA